MKLFHFFFTIQISNYRKRIDLSAMCFFVCIGWEGQSLAEGAGRKWSFLVHSTLHVSTHVGPCSNKSQNPRAARIQSQHILLQEGRPPPPRQSCLSVWDGLPSAAALGSFWVRKENFGSHFYYLQFQGKQQASCWGGGERKRI